jgi:hypothetical protein
MKTKAMMAALVALIACGKAQANLGDNYEQLVLRAGQPEHLTNDLLVFETSTGGAIVMMYNNVSTLEVYTVSTIPLVQGKPPSDVVRQILNSNLPGEKWVETSSEGSGADYVMSTTDGRFIAALQYHGLSGNVNWTLAIGSTDAYVRFSNLTKGGTEIGGVKIGEEKESPPVVVSPKATPAPKAYPSKVSSWSTDHLMKRRAELVQRFKDNSFGIYFGPMRWVSHAIDEKKSRDEFLAISKELNRRGVRGSTEIPKEGD